MSETPSTSSVTTVDVLKELDLHFMLSALNVLEDPLYESFFPEESVDREHVIANTRMAIDTYCRVFTKGLAQLYEKQILTEYPTVAEDPQLLESLVHAYVVDRTLVFNDLSVSAKDVNMNVKEVLRKVIRESENVNVKAVENTDAVYKQRYYTAMHSDYGFVESQAEEIALNFFAQETTIPYERRYYSAYNVRQSLQFQAIIEKYRKTCESDSVVLDTIHQYLLARDPSGAQHAKITAEIIDFMRTISSSKNLTDFECLVKGIQQERATVSSVILTGEDDSELTESLKADVAAMTMDSSFLSDSERTRTALENVAGAHDINVSRVQFSGLKKIAKAATEYAKTHADTVNDKRKQLREERSKREEFFKQKRLDDLQAAAAMENKLVKEPEQSVTEKKSSTDEGSYTRDEVCKIVDEAVKRDRAEWSAKRSDILEGPGRSRLRETIDRATNVSDNRDPYIRSGYGDRYDRRPGQPALNFTLVTVILALVGVIAFMLHKPFFGISFIAFAVACLLFKMRRTVPAIIVVGISIYLFIVGYLIL